MNATMVSHVVLGIIVIAFGLMHRHDLKRIVIEFKNGKDHEVDREQ